MTERIPLIAGNWKMNLDHLQAIALIQKLSWTLKDAGHEFDRVEVAVFPPFTDLRTSQTLIDAEKFELSLGAQDLSANDSGAHTGDISGAFLAKLDCKYVLIGHSERRQQHGESDEVVQGKVAAAFRHNLIPIICVGETLEELESEGQSAVPIRQALAALGGHPELGEFVIAYEPVWAIGTGKIATPEQAASVAGAIRAAVSEHFDGQTGDFKVLYGGSVKANNVAGFMQHEAIDGVLVGGASLDAEEFSGIARYQKHIVL